MARVDRRWKERDSKSLLVRFVLRCCDAARPVLAAAGVTQYAEFRTLLEARIRLDLRGGEAFNRFGLPIMLAMIWLSGFLPGIFALFLDDGFLWMSIAQAWSMFLVGMVLLLQLGNILVDTTDVHVVGPLPVADRTLYAARIVHAFAYVSLLAGCVAFWPMLLGAIGVSPWVLALYPVCAVFSTMLVVAAVALFYAAVLRVFGPSRFQSVVTWLQVAVSALAFGGYQVFARVVQWREAVELFEAHPKLMAGLPPLYYGALYELLTGAFTQRNLALGLAGVLLPLVAFALATQLAAGDLVRGLLSPAQRDRTASRSWKPPRSHLPWLASFVTSSRDERAGFDYAISLSRTERLYLRMAFSQVIGFSVMAFVMAMMFTPSSEGWSFHLAPFALYVVPLLLPTIVEMGQMTENPAGAWIFEALPVDEPERVFRGAIKGLLFGTAFPAFAAICLVAGLVSGVEGLADLLLAFELTAILSFVTVRRMNVRLPFTFKFRHGHSQAVNVLTVMVIFFFIVLAIGAHALVRLHLPLQLACIAVLAVFVVYTYRGLGRIGCEKRHTQYIEAFWGPG